MVDHRTFIPAGIPNIKRLAKAISRETGEKYAVSLDLASRRAGYESFKHAQNVLHTSGS
jgi:hypothetical protein